MIDVYGTLSDNGAPEGYLLADGTITGGLANDLGDTSSPPPGNTQAEWDSTTASNASHTLQAVGYDGAWAFVSPALSVTASNAFSAWTGNDVLVQSDGDPAWAQMTAPAGTVSWTVQIADPSGNLARSWSGAGQTVQFSWDGTTAAGVAENLYGQHSASVTAFDGSGGRTAVSWAISVLVSAPQGLALFEFRYPDDPQDVLYTKLMAHHVTDVFAALGSYSFTGLVLTSQQRTRVSRIKRWMQTTVRDFYICSHGIDPQGAGAAIATYWRDINFWPLRVDRGVDLNHPGVNWVIQTLLGGPGGREYNFAFCDFCRGAGGTVEGLPWIQDFTWANAFNIALPGVDPYNDHGTFWGWDGDAVVFHAGPAFSGPSNWYEWDYFFWSWLGLSPRLYVSAAALFATIDTLRLGIYDGGWDPWDYQNGYYRAQLFGDPLGLLP